MKKFFIILTIIAAIGIIMYNGWDNSSISIEPIPTKVAVITPKPTVKPTPEISEEKEQIYIGNKNSKKFHYPNCHTLPAEKNRVEFSSRDNAIDRGYKPCRNCNP